MVLSRLLVRNAVGARFTTIASVHAVTRTLSTTTTAATNAANISIPSNFTSNTSPYLSGESTHFGFETVGVNEKQDRVKQVFASVADSYDVMNDFMSAGLHRYWKDYLLQISKVESIAKTVRRRSRFNYNNNNSTAELSSSPSSSSSNNQPPFYSILDVAGGTGDVAFRFVDAAGCVERARSSGRDEISVTVCDINVDMLRVGQDRARERYGEKLLVTLDNDSSSSSSSSSSSFDSASNSSTGALKFVEGNAQDLHQFADNTFDLYTIAFGLRNVTDVDKALSEAQRVLRPGGRFICLEFSHVPSAYLRTVYDAYSFNVIPVMGEYIAHDRASYQYLVESIRQFPKQNELVARMQQAGLQNCQYTNLTGGIVAIHEGYKGLA